MALDNTTLLSKTTNTIILSEVIDVFYQNSVLAQVAIDKSDIARNNKTNKVQINYVSTATDVADTSNIDGDDIANSTITLANADIALDDYKAIKVQLSPQLSAQSQVDYEMVIARTVGAKWAEYIDKTLATTLTGQGSGSTEAIADPHNLTEALILKARTELKANKLPSADFTDKFLAVPPSQYGALLKIANFTDASKYGVGAPIANGELGRIHGFTVVETTSLSNSTANTSKAVAFQRQAVQFATQLQSMKVVTDVATTLDHVIFYFGWGNVALQIDERSYGFTTLA